MARAKREESEFREEWKPTREDAKNLKDNLKPFTQIRIHGKLVSPFEQYCASIHVTRLDPEGTVVLDPVGYTKLLEIDGYRQALDRFDQETLFNAFPEEREAYMARIRAMRPVGIVKRMPAVQVED